MFAFWNGKRCHGHAGFCLFFFSFRFFQTAIAAKLKCEIRDKQTAALATLGNCHDIGPDVSWCSICRGKGWEMSRVMTHTASSAFQIRVSDLGIWTFTSGFKERWMPAESVKKCTGVCAKASKWMTTPPDSQKSRIDVLVQLLRQKFTIGRKWAQVSTSSMTWCWSRDDWWMLAGDEASVSNKGPSSSLKLLLDTSHSVLVISWLTLRKNKQ